MQCPYDGKDCFFISCGHEYENGGGLRSQWIEDPEKDCKWLRDIKKAQERKEKSREHAPGMRVRA